MTESCVLLDWLVVPWGASAELPNNLRYGVRMMPTIPSQTDETSGRLPDGIFISRQALKDWPAFLSGVQGINLRLTRAGSATTSFRQDVAATYRAHLRAVGLTVEQASRLWKAAVGDLVDAIGDGACTATAPDGRQYVEYHRSSELAAGASTRMANVFADSLRTGHNAGKTRSTNQGRVEPGTPSQQGTSLLRAGAAIYASIKRPARQYADFKADFLKTLPPTPAVPRPGQGTQPAALTPPSDTYTWASAVLNQRTGSPTSSSQSSESKTVPAPTAPGAAAVLPLSTTSLSYVLLHSSVADSMARKSSSSNDDARDDIPLDDFGYRVLERRFAYSSMQSPQTAASAPQRQAQARLHHTSLPTQDLKGLVEALHTRLASLTAHPWLAKMVGLVVDMTTTLDMRVDKIDSIGIDRVELTDGSQALRPAMTRMKDGFPCSASQDALYARGVMKLARDGFLLTQIDVDRTPDRYLQAAIAFETQLQAGQMASRLNVATQPQETVGLSLIERDAKRQTAALDTDDSSADENERRVYLEHLLAGYRPDVQAYVPFDTGEVQVRPWQPLTARRIRSVRLGGMDITDWFSKIGRCESHIAERTRLVDVEQPDGSTQKQSFIEGQLFRWSVWGLGAGPGSEFIHPDSQVTVSQDAIVGAGRLEIHYDPVALPPQRFGHGYRVGVRLAMIDGNSLATSEAATLAYEALGADVTAGDDPAPAPAPAADPPETRAATFHRFEPVLPPAVLLIDRPDRRRFPKESARHVVVATSRQPGHHQHRAWRVLAPPRASSMDLCFRHGVLDAFRDAADWPAAPFADVVQTPAGDFPAERFAFTGLESHAAATQELYFRRLAVPPPPPKTPYYPDPWARRAILGFYRPGDDRLMYVEFFDYYGARSAWPNCRELRMCVERASSVVHVAAGFDVTLDGSAGVVKVALMPGVHVVLRVWHELTFDMLAQSGVVEQMAQLAADEKLGCDLRQSTGIDSPPPYDLEDMRTRLLGVLSQWEQRRDWATQTPRPYGRPSDIVNLTSFWMLNPYAELDLMHAVEQPLRPPALADGSDKTPLVPQILQAPAPMSAFERPFEIVRSVAATKAVFHGHVRLDRFSTARIDASAHWIDNPRSASRASGSKRFGFVPQARSTHLFSVRDIVPVAQDDLGAPPVGPLDPELPPTKDLQLLDALRPIRASEGSERMPTVEDHDFGDTRARVVDVVLSGVSRFADEFGPNQDKRQDTAPGQRVVVHGTQRPDAPEVEYVVPVLNWNAAGGPGVAASRQREPGWFRIWLGSKWYSSGNGELLALVCAPAELLDPKAHSRLFLRRRAPSVTYAEPNSVIEKWVTRWGLDPLLDEDIEFLEMPASALRNRLMTLADVEASGGPQSALDVDLDHLQETPTFQPTVDLALLPEFSSQAFVASAKGSAPSSQVVLALYRPILDEASGRMYVDIQVDPQAAYQPFLRLALAGYQPHGLHDRDNDLRLSPIVTTEFVQLMPGRTATVTIQLVSGAHDGRVRIAIAGPTLDDRSGSKPGLASVFTACLEHRRAGLVLAGEEESINGAWTPAASAESETITLHREAALQVWSGETAYRTRLGYEYSIRIEERETIANNDVGRLVYFDRLMINN
jgi:hypothetical protein